MVQMNRAQRRALESHERRMREVFAVMDSDPVKAVAMAKKVQPPDELNIGPMADRTVLAGLHKARVMSPVATDAQAEESRSWLRSNGYREETRAWRH